VLCLPFLWRAATLRPTIDQRSLAPLSSSWARGEPHLITSGLPPGIVLPSLVTVTGSDFFKSQSDPAPSVCVDYDGLLQAQLPLIMPKGILHQLHTFFGSKPTCVALESAICHPGRMDLLSKTLPGFAVAILNQTATRLRAICPKTCGCCQEDQKLVLTATFFDALHAMEKTYIDSIYSVGGGLSDAGEGVLLHVAKFGKDRINVLDAQRYLMGDDGINASEIERATSYRHHFARLTNLDCASTVMVGYNPFRCMSSEAGVWYKDLVVRVHDNSDLANLSVTLLVHESSVQLESDATTNGMLKAAALAIGLLLVLTGALFRSVMLPPRLLFTVLFTLGIAYGTCGFMIDAFLLEGIYWTVPPATVPILTGLTLDYDLFILTRVLEYRCAGYTTKQAFQVGIDSTRDVISVAGVIMALAFSGIATSELLVLREFGVVLVVGTLCDTFFIRPLLVPACALAMGDPELNWWPRKMPPIKGLGDAIDGGDGLPRLMESLTEPSTEMQNLRLSA